MGIVLAIVLAVLGFAPQAPLPVPARLPGEPHHHLKVDNTYIRAYYVEVRPHDQTQLHQHDYDYIYVTLGDAKVVNAVLGKPDVLVMLKDGEVRFTSGGFAHIARNLTASPFRNVTVELLRRQGAPRNRCEKVASGPPGKCETGAEDKGGPMRVEPLLETDEARVDRVTVPNGPHAIPPRAEAALLIVVSGAPLKVEGVSDQRQKALQSGEMIWLPPHAQPQVTVAGAESRLLLISFKDATAK